MNQRGQWGEDHAVEYLLSNDYKILVRNFRTPHGEIDIICSHDDTLVFVEVKTRKGNLYGNPYESVTPFKRYKMQRAAAEYLRVSNEGSVLTQFDVISISLNNGKAALMHFKNAIEA